MRILITNDDGVAAAQLPALIRWCQKLGDVTTVVPKYEQSGKSHGIELHKPYEAVQRELEPGLTVWTVDSTPADCVRFAVLGLKQEFDLCISGINRGFNIGTDIVYSGTVGAAGEAVALGIKAVALSTSPGYYDRAVSHLDRVFDFLFQNDLFEHCDFYNVNIPPQPGQIHITHQGGPYYSDDYLPLGNDLYQASGRCVYEDNGDETLDTNTVMHGHISIMPVTTDKTDTAVYRKIAALYPHSVQEVRA